MGGLFRLRPRAIQEPLYVGISGTMTLTAKCFVSYVQSMGHTAIAIPVQELELMAVQGIAVPQVFIINISNGDGNDLGPVMIVKKIYPEVPVLMLSLGDDIAVIINSIKSGAAGFIQHTIDPAELELALRVVLNGEGYFFDLEKERLVYHDKLDIRDPVRIMAAAGLRSNQKNVLRWLYSTCSKEEIARQLACSPRTLEAYVSTLAYALQIKSRVGMVLFAVKNNLVEDEQTGTG